MKLHDLITEEMKQDYRSERFVRWGGLSATPHDIHYKERKDYFHTPPGKKGIFVFMNGFVHHDLYKWKIEDEKKKQSHTKKRNFSYKGKIWTHVKIVDKDIKYYGQKGSWYETDTDSIKKVFLKGKPKGVSLELFIEKKHLGGI